VYFLGSLYNSQALSHGFFITPKLEGSSAGRTVSFTFAADQVVSLLTSNNVKIQFF